MNIRVHGKQLRSFFSPFNNIPAKANGEQGDKATMTFTNESPQCYSYLSTNAKVPCSRDKTATLAISENLFTL